MTNRNLRALFVGLGFVALATILLSDVALTGKSYLLRDVLTFFHPWQVAVRQALTEGQLPFWNHDTYCGIPLLANLQSGVFYPINWLYSVLPFDLALTGGMVLHLAIAGTTLALFLARLGASPPAACFGGIAFAFGTWATSHLEFPMKLGAAVWLPLLWVGVWDSMVRGRRRGLGIGAAALTLSLLAGYPQITTLACISATVLALGIALSVGRDASLTRGDKVHRLGAWPVIVVLGAITAAVQLLPSSEMAALSSKTEPYSRDVALARSLPWRALAGAVDPFWLGMPGIDRFFGGRLAEFAFASFYGGLLAVVAVGLGAFAQLGSSLRVVTIALGSGGVLAILLALGENTAVYPFLHAHAPGFGSSRWPATAVFLMSVHGAALAGLGADALLRSTSRMQRAGFVATALAIVLLMLSLFEGGPAAEAVRSVRLGDAPSFQVSAYDEAALPSRNNARVRAGLLLLAGLATVFVVRRCSPRTAQRTGWAWCALLFVELFVTARAYGTPSARGFYDETPESVASLREELGNRRLFTPRATDQLGNFLYGARNDQAFAWAKRALLCNANIPHGIAQAHGCEPLNPRRHEAFVQAFDAPETPWSLKERIFDLWDAGCLLTSRVRAPEIATWSDEEGGVELSRHTPRLARASVLSHWQTETEPSQVLRRLFARRHDPALTTIIEPLEVRTLSASEEEPHEYHAVSWENVTNGIRIHTPDSPGGMLRVLTSWDPGWQARVNGVPTPIHRADFLFLGIPVPEGSVEVDLTYRAPRFFLGLAGSLVGLVLLGLCVGLRQGATRTIFTTRESDEAESRAK